MGISSKIFQGIAKSVKGFLNVWAPVLFVKGIAECGPFIGTAQFFAGSGKLQAGALIKGIKRCKEFSLEFIPEDFYGEEEAFLCFPYFMVLGEPAARDNAMHMYMVKHLLIPGMEYLDDAGDCT